MARTRGRKEQLKPRNETRLGWLYSLWTQLKIYNSKGTGIPNLDAELIATFGAWR